MRKILYTVIIIFLFVNSYALTEPINNAGWSLLFPGTGLHRSGNSIAGYVFNGIEAGAVITTAVSYITSVNYSNNALSYASLSLNRDASLYSDDMLSKIEFYDSSDEYNDLLPSKARDIYPDDPALQEQYIVNHWIPDSLSWEWQDTEDKEEFYEMRKNSRTYRQVFTVAGSAIIINHVLSAIITYIDTDNRLKNVETAGFVYENGFNLSMRYRF